MIEYIQTVVSSSRISKREKYQCTCTYNFHVNSRHKRLLKLDRRSTACPAIGLATNRAVAPSFWGKKNELVFTFQCVETYCFGLLVYG